MKMLEQIPFLKAEFEKMKEGIVTLRYFKLSFLVSLTFIRCFGFLAVIGLRGSHFPLAPCKFLFMLY